MDVSRDPSPSLPESSEKEPIHARPAIEAQVEAVRARIPEPREKEIWCSEGWHRLIAELDLGLGELFPNYQVQQVKEKLGGLRFYWAPAEDPSSDDFAARLARADRLVAEAERRSLETCELCGAAAAMTKTPPGRYRTLCGSCADEGGYEPLG